MEPFDAKCDDDDATERNDICRFDRKLNGADLHPLEPYEESTQL